MKLAVSTLVTVLVASIGPAAAEPFTKGLAPVEAPVGDLLARRVPEGGLWLASLTRADPEGARFFVYRLDKGGVHEVHREDHTSIYTYGWADADTLWTVAHDGDPDAGTSVGVIVSRFVRGQKDREHRVAHASWKRSEGAWVQLHLQMGPRAEVALVRCHAFDFSVAPFPCTASTTRRLEGQEWIQRSSLAPGTRDVVARREEPTVPAARQAVPGYRLERVGVGDGVKGFRCTGPDGVAFEWPSYKTLERELQVQPQKFRWLHDQPPLLAVEGPRQTYLELQPRRVQVMRACSPEMLPGFHWLGDGIWTELVLSEDKALASTQWKIWIDDVHVASVHGDERHLVPAPR